MIIKLKQKFFNLKITEHLKKLTIVKKIKKPSKILLPVLFVIFLVFPLDSYAEEIIDQTNTQTSSNKWTEFGKSLVGLKKCLNPRATQLQKAIYCTRPCCLLAGITSSYAVENTAIGTPIHKIATLCCASSWGTYAFLTFVDTEKIIKKKIKAVFI